MNTNPTKIRLPDGPPPDDHDAEGLPRWRCAACGNLQPLSGFYIRERYGKRMVTTSECRQCNRARLHAVEERRVAAGLSARPPSTKRRSKFRITERGREVLLRRFNDECAARRARQRAEEEGKTAYQIRVIRKKRNADFEAAVERLLQVQAERKACEEAGEVPRPLQMLRRGR